MCYINGGVPLHPALRREYRTLSDDERQRFHNAVRQLKFNGEYDRFSMQHRDVCFRQKFKKQFFRLLNLAERTRVQDSYLGIENF